MLRACAGAVALAGLVPLAGAAGDPRTTRWRNAMDITDVSLSAQHTATARELRVRYTIANKSGGDIYVLDGRRKPGADKQVVVSTSDYALIVNDAGDAEVLVGIAPLPANKLVAVRIMPVATKLAPGASQTRELDPIPLPLTQRTPYTTADELLEAQTLTVQRLVLGVQFIRASAPGLVATPLSFAPQHYDVKTPQTVQDALEARVVLVQQSMPLRIVPRPR